MTYAGDAGQAAALPPWTELDARHDQCRAA